MTPRLSNKCGITPEWLLRALLACGTLLVSGPLAGQAFELSAGTSTLDGTQGASLAIHGQNSESTFGAGVEGGRFGASGSMIRRVAGGSMSFGQQQFSLELPTDVFRGGHVLRGLGVGIRLKRDDEHDISGFLGMSSSSSGSSIFQSASLSSPTGLLQFSLPVGDFCHTIFTGLFSSALERSALQSLTCSPSPHLTYAFTGGIGGSSLYGATSARYQTRKLDLQASFVQLGQKFQRGTDLDVAAPESARENVAAQYRLSHSFTLSASHRNFLTAWSEDSSGDSTGSPENATRSSLDQVAVSYHQGSTLLNLTALHSADEQPSAPSGSSSSSSDVAFFASASHVFNRLQWNESLVHSVSNLGTGNTMLINGIAIAVNPHLRLTENVNVTANGPTFSHGGALTTAFSSLEVDYQLLYLASRPDQPFQQAMMIDAHFRILPNLWAHAVSSISATGRPLYTFSTGTSFSRAASPSRMASQTALGPSMLEGRVLDEQGTPVSGAAILIGSSHVYSDSKGFFLYREQSSHLHPFSVLLDEFIEMDRYTVVSAPKEVRTLSEQLAKPLNVVLSRVKPPAEPSQRASDEVPSGGKGENQ